MSCFFHHTALPSAPSLLFRSIHADPCSCMENYCRSRSGTRYAGILNFAFRSEDHNLVSDTCSWPIRFSHKNKDNCNSRCNTDSPKLHIEDKGQENSDQDRGPKYGSREGPLLELPNLRSYHRTEADSTRNTIHMRLSDSEGFSHQSWHPEMEYGICRLFSLSAKPLESVHV